MSLSGPVELDRFFCRAKNSGASLRRTDEDLCPYVLRGRAALARTLAPTSIFLCYTPTVFFKSHFLCPRVIGMKLRPLVLPLAVIFAVSFSPTISGAQAVPATPRPITVEDYFQ